MAMQHDVEGVRLPELRTGRVVGWMLAVVALLSLALVLVSLAALREDQLRSGERAMRAQGRLTEEIIASRLLAADLGLQSAAEVLRAPGPLLQRDPAWARERLRGRLAALPQLRAMWVLDGRGRIIFDSDSGNFGLDLSDRDFFTAHRDGRVPGLFVGRGIRSRRTTGDWIVPLSREVRDAAGNLDAVFVAALEPRYFVGLWGDVDVGANGSISLLSGDGVLLMRSPAWDELLGQSFAKSPVVGAMLGQPAGFIHRAYSDIDGLERIFSLHVVAKYPGVIIVLGASVDHVLKNWRRSAALTLAAWFAGTLVLGILGWVLARELRGRRKVELQLASLARVAEEDPNPILRLDAAGTVMYANPAAVRLRQAISRAGGEAPAAWEAFAAHAARAVEPATLEADLVGASYSLTVAPVQSLGYVNVYATEITDRKLGEQRLRAQLARTELLHRITRAIGDRLELQSVLQVVSDSVQSQLPAPLCAAAVLEGSPPRLVVRCIAMGSTELALESRLGLASALPGGDDGRYAPDAPLYQRELEGADDELAIGLRRAGMRSAVMAPLQVEGRLFGLLVVARSSPGAFAAEEVDFLGQLGQHAALAAQQAQLHATLRQAYDELMRTQRSILRQEGLRALGQMAGGIAHDINNALSPVALYTESLLEGEPQLSARAREYLQSIQRAVDDVTRTVERLREFHRPIDDTSERQLGEINALVREVAELAAQKFLGSNLGFDLQLDEKMPPVEFLQAELREALLNLLNNARDAMPEGGTIVLRTSTAFGADGILQAHVDVIDSGIGMSEVTARRCLEPFFTTKGERGTGLGLPMVYGAMQRHRGDVEIESELGHGTRIRLVFPAKAAPDPSGARSAPAGALHSQLRILLIDDDAAVLSSVQRMLEFDGHDVAIAPGGRAGIEAFEAALRGGHPFALVITDLGMPEVDGIQAAQAIKAVRPDTWIILLTGWGEEVSDAAQVAGAVDQVLGKPPRLAQVRQALGRFVAEAK